MSLTVAEEPAHRSLAELNAEQVKAITVVVGATEIDGKFTLGASAMATLRDELHALFAFVRSSGQLVTELMSATALDQATRQLAKDLLEAAQRSPNKCRVTDLATGKTLVLARQNDINALGFDGVCRVVHLQAIEAAKSLRLPFCAASAALYQAAPPFEMA